MKKSIIALAIAAALPVAAQADATISGSVKVTYASGGAVTNTAALKIASSEVLANGMTATASMNILSSTDSGVASLAGDFGTLTMGKIDDDAAFQAGDIGGRVGDSSGTTTTNTYTNGVHYAGTVANLTVAAQTNGTSTQASATYDFNGLALGFATADAAAATDGVTGDMTAVGATYSFGDLSVKVGKASTEGKAVGSVTYATTVEAIAITATASSDSSSSVKAVYTLDGIALTAKAARSSAGVTSNSLSATYTSGDLTLTADDSNTVSAALDLGNADLSVKRETGTTTMTYTVAF